MILFPRLFPLFDFDAQHLQAIADPAISSIFKLNDGSLRIPLSHDGLTAGTIATRLSRHNAGGYKAPSPQAAQQKS
jgi:hypothetical protein